MGMRPGLTERLEVTEAEAGRRVDAVLADDSMPDKVEQSYQVATRLFSMDAFVDELLGTIALEDHRRSLSGWMFPPGEAPQPAPQHVN